jgi:TetR/AcrR family tetracycline transcriptional repressor
MSTEKPSYTSDSSDKPNRGAAKSRAPHLAREKVLDATLDLLNEEGFDGLTLRRVADKLGVKAAALYWHFESKQDLINHLAARIFEREFDTTEADLAKHTWRQILTGMGHGFCAGLMRYRDGAMVIASADLSQTGQGFNGRQLVVAELIRKGMPEKVIFSAMFTIVRYVLGYVFEEQADPQAQKKGTTYLRNAEPALRKEFPKATDEFIQMYEQLAENSRHQFEQGLELILDGIEKKLTA